LAKRVVGCLCALGSHPVEPLLRRGAVRQEESRAARDYCGDARAASISSGRLGMLEAKVSARDSLCVFSLSHQVSRV
jgi:hypothetical protein